MEKDRKHIPQVYLRASEDVRLELLAGLLDTDGTYQETGHFYEFTQSERWHERLFDDAEREELSSKKQARRSAHGRKLHDGANKSQKDQSLRGKNRKCRNIYYILVAMRMCGHVLQYFGEIMNFRFLAFVAI